MSLLGEVLGHQQAARAGGDTDPHAAKPGFEYEQRGVQRGSGGRRIRSSRPLSLECAVRGHEAGGAASIQVVHRQHQHSPAALTLNTGGEQMRSKVTPTDRRRGSIRATVAMIAALIVVPSAAPVAPAQAQTSNSCLSVENNRSRTTSVTVVGFNETTGYWSFAAGESAVLTTHDSPIRGATFTLRAYDGDGIDSARQLAGSNKYVNWRYDAQDTDSGKCPDGIWVATLHD